VSGEGHCPSPEKFVDFESENGDFWCILGACTRGEGGMTPPGPLGSASVQTDDGRAIAYSEHAKNNWTQATGPTLPGFCLRAHVRYINTTYYRNN